MSTRHVSATLSDATSVASPTPFSPFSSAFSTASEAATVVSDGQADLGAFNSVFFALSQLQLQHTHSLQSPRRAPVFRESTTNTLDELLVGTTAADTRVNTTLADTPNFRPHSMSPLSLDRRTQTQSRSSRLTPTRSTPSDDPEAAPYVDSAGSLTDVDGDIKSDTGLAASSAAEDGDEESLEASASPQSQSSPDAHSAVSDDRDEEILEYDPSRGWTLSAVSPAVEESDSFSSESSRYEIVLALGTDTSGPSLGEFNSAFEFFAAERAKLARPAESVRTGSTPTTTTQSLPVKAKGKNSNARQNHGRSPKKNKTASKANNDGSFRVIAVAHFDKGRVNPGKGTGVTLVSSDDLGDSVRTAKKLPRGILPRLKQHDPIGSASLPSSATVGPSTLVKSNNSGGPLPMTNSNRRPGNHRHTRSLPTNNVAPAVLSVTRPLTSDALNRIKSLARRLTFQFPADAPSLRAVIASPEAALGFGIHPAPSDDALVSGGFYEPSLGPDAIAIGSTSLGLSTVQQDHLYVFIDHSNILVGYLEWLKKQSPDVFPGGKRPQRPKLSHAALVLLLSRGRKSMRKVLVASSPLHQSLDEIASMGYQISVLQRVEIKEGLTGPAPPRSQTRPKQARGRTAQKAPNNDPSVGLNNGSSTESDSGGQKDSFTASTANNQRVGRLGHNRRSTSDDSLITPSASSKSLNQMNGDATTGMTTTAALSSSPGGRPRFREEAVDELLQLKLLQTLLDAPSPPPRGSTIVLASGDAARSQFNPQGFLGCVRKAVERGWKVEVVGWDEGRSRAYAELFAEVERGEVGKEMGGKLEIISLDQWGLDLIDA